MMLKRLAINIAKKALIGVLTLGVIISIGLLSYCGMLAITPSIALAWVAFALAGLIDGEVYLQNITSGIDNLKLLTKDGLSVLITQALDKQLRKEPDAKAGTFAQEYFALRKYLVSFEHKKLTREQAENKRHAEKRLQRMRKYFVTQILATTPKENDALFTDIRKQLDAMRRKLWYIRISVPICLAAGVGFGFATAAALDAALIGMTAALSVFIWPLAIVACVGYAFLIYRTISDMISNETVRKWAKTFRNWFTRDKNEKPYIYGLRVVGTAALLIFTIGVGILATLATAGTWWVAVKNGAMLLPALIAAANYIRNILVPIASFTNLIFTIRNSLESVKNILKKLRNFHPIEAWQQKRKSLFKDENYLQIFNPFRAIAKIISLPFMFVVFVGHLISVGLMGDRAPGLNYEATIASAAAGAISDGLVDYHYVADHQHGDTKDKKKLPKHHDHHHGLIAEWLLRFVLSPILLLAAVWDFTAARGFTSANPKERFICSLKKSFGITMHKAYDDTTKKPQTSTEWLQHEINLRFSKYEKRAKQAADAQSLATLKASVQQKINDPTYVPDAKAPLLFKSKKIQSFAIKVQTEYLAPAVR